MSNTDTSDEAFLEWYKSHPLGGFYPPKFNAMDAWQECRRRCETQMEEERCKYFREGVMTEKEWIAEQAELARLSWKMCKRKKKRQ